MFKVGDRVRTSAAAHTVGIGMNVEGTVEYVACQAATSKGGNTCDKKTCPHSNKEICWVRWVRNPSKLQIYNERFLEYDDLQPKDDRHHKNETSKDPYIEQAKETIKSKILSDASFDWKMYNGFRRVVYDRAGNQYIKEVDSNSETEDKKPISNLDFDSYNRDGVTKSKN